MPHYNVSLGDTVERGGEGYGTVTAESPEQAVRAVRHEADRTRDYVVTELSHSVDYGRGDARINGNGAQDRGDWWYLTDAGSGRFVGVFESREAPIPA